MSRWAPTVLRFGLASIFIAHGLVKLLPMGEGGGPAATAAAFAQLGLTPAFPLALLAGLVEAAGGTLLALGLFTRAAAGVLGVQMLVALWVAHWPHGFFLNWTVTPGRGHGIEYALLLVAALVAVALTGGGALSFDARRTRDAEAAAAGRARLRAGGS